MNRCTRGCINSPCWYIIHPLRNLKLKTNNRSKGILFWQPYKNTRRDTLSYISFICVMLTLLLSFVQLLLWDFFEAYKRIISKLNTLKISIWFKTCINCWGKIQIDLTFKELVLQPSKMWSTIFILKVHLIFIKEPWKNHLNFYQYSRFHIEKIIVQDSNLASVQYIDENT